MQTALCGTTKFGKMFDFFKKMVDRWEIIEYIIHG